jgi:hypothetical protein
MVARDRTLEWQKMDCPTDSKPRSGGPTLWCGGERIDLGSGRLLDQAEFTGLHGGPAHVDHEKPLGSSARERSEPMTLSPLMAVLFARERIPLDGPLRA